ncbi:hypothetical protein M5W83_04750 [Paenibacillus thiaminolyticus]|uniref:Uncharacterized protein n=1 Tax=Paenibacillus thiaminolyticus TaxID=49283 RepID=A0AAP9DZ78_PANTH|nr:hypothetical protein [Paenibacillus thiaminolyticus]MCY9534491.1 hypothetical protein [Paenibacillus thiaminolyticus]MCY9601301.1 hypothetical protein [Paenibacillus thiaminolyticus]MCY9606469.1 hypothetical protein [Paenibacillus thiaminolyticus]MCY9614069.1 hypothetical protein [Paenibacillus thiaminolyticus]MCY9618606.1 hypothetical protein [Paenibacillus thiaminolyticus]
MYTFNPKMAVENFKNGKLFTDVVTRESFFLEDEIYHIIQPAAERYVTIHEIYHDSYPFEEFEAFIEELVLHGILISHPKYLSLMEDEL